MTNLARRISQANKIFMFVSEFTRDFIYYAKYCGVSPFQQERKKLYYKIIIEAHAIEKGLSLSNPRSLFGRAKVNEVLQMVTRYGMDSDDLPILMSVGVLSTYLNVHRSADIMDPMLDEIAAFLDKRARQSNTPGSGGLRHFQDGLSATQENVGSPVDLLTSRFSCRMFADSVIDPSEIEKIVALAQTAPSQCNRQSTRVHFYSNPSAIKDLLLLQQGSSGFSESVRGLFVISFDLAAWGGAQQRNQGYVDAALLSQNLMLASHAMGLATCPLNLAVRHATERRIRQVGNIPDDQRLVMMIAIGWPTTGALKAAASPRRPVAEVLTLHATAA